MNHLKKPNFYQIPEIVASQVKPHDSFVFSVIYWFEKMKDGKCFASNETIAEALPYKSSGPSVANSLVKLEKLGFIKRIFEDDLCRIRKEIKCLIDYRVSPTDGGGITHRLRGVSSTDEHNSNTIILTSNINKELLEYWNNKKIVQHKESPIILKDIDKALKNYLAEDVKKAIDNYADIFKSQETYFKHKWTISEFLGRKNALPVFLNKSIDDYLINGIRKTKVYKNQGTDSMLEKIKAKNNLQTS